MPRDKRVEVELVAKIGRFVGGLKKGAGALAKFGKQGAARLGVIANGLGSMVKSAAKWGAGIVAAGAAAAYGLVKVARVGEDTQKALGELASLGIKDLGALEDAAKDFTNTFGGTKADFISASYDIKSALSNLSDAAVGGFTKVAALTAKATKAAVGEMTNLFAVAYGIYKDQFKSMSDMDFADMLSGGISQAVKMFRTTGPEMQQAISTLGATATQAGMEMAEQFAVLGMLQKTMSGSEAGTALKSFVIGAGKAVKQTAKMIDKLGKEEEKLTKERKKASKGRQKEIDAEIKALRDQAAGLTKFGESLLTQDGRLRSITELLTVMRNRYGDVIDVAERNQIKELFGREEGIKVIELLVGQIGELEKNVTGLGDAMSKGSAVTNEMAWAQMTATDRIGALSASFRNVMEEIAKGLRPTLLDLTDILRNRFVAWQDDAKGWADSIKAWYATHRDAIKGYITGALDAFDKFRTEGIQKLIDAWPKIAAATTAAWDNLKLFVADAIVKIKAIWVHVQPIAKMIGEWIKANPATFGLILVLIKMATLLGPKGTIIAGVVAIGYQFGKWIADITGLNTQLEKLLGWLTKIAVEKAKAIEPENLLGVAQPAGEGGENVITRGLKNILQLFTAPWIHAAAERLMDLKPEEYEAFVKAQRRKEGPGLAPGTVQVTVQMEGGVIGTAEQVAGALAAGINSQIKDGNIKPELAPSGVE